MGVPTPKLQSIMPDLPRDNKICDEEGNLTQHWQLFFEQLTQAQQSNFTPEGFVIPQLPTTSIALLTDPSSIANIVYDSTVPAFKGNLGGVWMTFTLT